MAWDPSKCNFPAEPEDLPRNLKNLLENDKLKWLFVGGKGGVGKTTSSCSISIKMAEHFPDKKILIISTDPAHNVSDAFDQQFHHEAQQIENIGDIKNLYAMEIQPSDYTEGGGLANLLGFQQQNATMEGVVEEMQETQQTFLTEIMGSVPGIDEAVAFGKIMQNIQDGDDKYDLIIFDTAPTGHTLRLLNFPKLLEKGIVKLIQLKEKFGGMISNMNNMVSGPKADAEELHQKMFDTMDGLKTKIELINEQFKDPEQTTFVAVCIPEFLSMYETERLCIELAKQDIDIKNIIINNVLNPNELLGDKDFSTITCTKCKSRMKMQSKYIEQILELYDDFHITFSPQLNDEVRKYEKKTFSSILFEGYSKIEYDAEPVEAAQQD